MSDKPEKPEKFTLDAEREKIDVVERIAGAVVAAALPIGRATHVQPKLYGKLVAAVAEYLACQEQYGKVLAKDSYIGESLKVAGIVASRVKLLANIHNGTAELKDQTKPMPADATTLDGQSFDSPVTMLTAEVLGYTKVYGLYAEYWTTATKGQGRKAPTLDTAAARTLQSRKDGLGPGRLWTPAANASHFLALFGAMIGLPTARALWPPDDMLTVQSMLGEAHKRASDAQVELDARDAPPPVTASQAVADQAEIDRSAETVEVASGNGAAE